MDGGGPGGDQGGGSSPSVTVPRWPDVLRAAPRRTRAVLARHDLALVAAGLTFYAALAVVPLLLVAGWLAGLVAGRDRVRDLGEAMGEALPSVLGADRVATGLVDVANDLGWLPILVAAFPATLYGEGLRRAYNSLAEVREGMVGWRGRLASLPVLAAAPLLLVGVLAVTPLLTRLIGQGPAATALGVYVALNVDWVAVSVPLAFSFRVVAPDPPPLHVAVVGGFATGAFVAGFLQGFVLFLSLPIDLGIPFGGLTEVGAAIAVLLWMWVLHLVVLVGYVATRVAWGLRSGG